MLNRCQRSACTSGVKAGWFHDTSTAAEQVRCAAVQMYAQTAEGQVDAMAANEVATHVSLQQIQDCPHLYKLLGGFEVLDSDSDGGREQASLVSLSMQCARCMAADAAATHSLQQRTGCLHTHKMLGGFLRQKLQAAQNHASHDNTEPVWQCSQVATSRCYNA